jgi:hypothetical protein
MGAIVTMPLLRLSSRRHCNCYDAAVAITMLLVLCRVLPAPLRVPYMLALWALWALPDHVGLCVCQTLAHLQAASRLPTSTL